MQTLIINGSLNKNGNTVALINEFKKSLKGEIIELSAYYDGIFPCFNCPQCSLTGFCKIKDKMNLVHEDAYDNIVIASPVYDLFFPGPLVNVLNRFQVYYVRERFLNICNDFNLKKSGLILVGGGDGTPRDSIGLVKWKLKLINAPLVDENIVTSLNTDEILAVQDEIAVDNVRKLALRLNNQEFVV